AERDLIVAQVMEADWITHAPDRQRPLLDPTADVTCAGSSAARRDGTEKLYDALDHLRALDRADRDCGRGVTGDGDVNAHAAFSCLRVQAYIGGQRIERQLPAAVDDDGDFRSERVCERLRGQRAPQFRRQFFRVDRLDRIESGQRIGD